MSKERTLGPKEAGLREMRETKTARRVGVTKEPKPKIPFAGKAKNVRGPTGTKIT